jgi:hypothetical protein
MQVLLCKLFNLCVKKGIPKDWQEIHITSLHKKGPKTDCNNYRGLAVMNVFPKLFSIILNKKIECLARANKLRAPT